MRILYFVVMLVSSNFAFACSGCHGGTAQFVGEVKPQTQECSNCHINK